MAINANFFTRVGEYRESSAIRIVNRSIRLNAGQEYQRRNFARQGSAPSGRNVEAVIMGKIVSMLMDKKNREGLAPLLRWNVQILPTQKLLLCNPMKNARELRLRGKMCFIEWNVEKIGHIYADWIES
ncbi:Hypothetical predicted protein [Olea europaea subsp. europaea]|uniref:Uncharacterized protein n=1 Tax=Olea europaea subsp. europaea TaxID=158383 RepID=A0A8S0T4D2_OLEEU|nr:Hypothetical predicted protein [Olea europaea subsp. europaea]